MTTTDTVNLPGGAALPMIGFGTWQLGPGTAYTSVRTALDVGYRHIDTATLYRNEADVGRAVKDSGVDREQVFITTKLRPQDAGNARRTLESSLRLLDTDYVDLWLIHWPTSQSRLVPAWEELLRAEDDGLIRNAGVSNFSPEQIDLVAEATGRRPAVNQIPWSPAQHDPATLEEHRRRGIVVEGYSGLKNTDLRHPTLTGIAERHGVTTAQVVLRWHLEHDIVILPRSRRPERIAANADLDGFTLTDDEIAAIDALSRCA
ncbi:MAG TPA: aldo/keto reductase [Spirillospora sp.]